MFDLNQILSAALTAAVAEAIRPLSNRIDELENLLLHRLEKVENNPAIGVDTTQHEAMVAMRDRIDALETKLTEAKLTEQTTNVTIPIDEAKMVEALNSQEWFWEKINAYIETGIEDRIERAIDDHCSAYNHDDYDNVYSEWGGESVDDFVKDGYIEEQIEEKVNETLRNASFEIRVL